MRILLDNGIFSHGEFAEPAIRKTTVRWGGTEQLCEVSGVVRKVPDKNLGYQRQKEALFTVGRLIREGHIQAFDYWEVDCERWRGSPGIQVCNALRGCESKIKRCQPALQRSKFCQTIEFTKAISKGGKKDHKTGVPPSGVSQVAFFERLCSLSNESVAPFIAHAAQIGLTAHDIGSLENIDWFQFLCRRSGSPENYPDVFHLWTAERNDFDALLTLEGGLPKLVSRVKNERRKVPTIKTEVLRPMDLLRHLGVDNPDPVPMDVERFYLLHELPNDW